MRWAYNNVSFGSHKFCFTGKRVGKISMRLHIWKAVQSCCVRNKHLHFVWLINMNITYIKYKHAFKVRICISLWLLEIVDTLNFTNFHFRLIMMIDVYVANSNGILLIFTCILHSNWIKQTLNTIRIFATLFSLMLFNC